ncbi:hypothetical protein [Rhizobium sp.]
MSSFVTKFAVATAIVMGSLGAIATTAPAQAASVDIVVKPRVVIKPAPRVVIKQAPRVVVVRPAPVIVVKPAGRCQPGLALAKASRNGLNKVAISHIGPNRVTVSGKIRGNWAKVSFANVRGCPGI